jgi:C-terminal processing protease CtpA/Prc
VVLPVATFFTWQGRNLEGCGVVPDIDEPVDTAALAAGQDPQLQRALSTLGAATA